MRKKNEDVMRRNWDTNKYMKALSKKNKPQKEKERGQRKKKKNMELIRLLKSVIEQH